MQEERVGKDDIEKMIIDYLIKHGETKLLELSNALGIEPQKLDYHLKKLIKKGIIIARGRYPAKYHINYKLVDPKKEFILAILSTVLYLSSIILLIQGNMIQSIISALIGLTISLPYIWRVFLDKYMNRVEKLLSISK